MRQLILLLCVVFTLSLNAQTKSYKKQIQQATKLMAAEGYTDAIGIYNSLIKTYPDDIFVKYKTAECYLFSETHIPEAIGLLEPVSQNYYSIDKFSVQSIESSYYLAQCYHLNGSYKKAITEYEDILKRLPQKNTDAVNKIARGIQNCNNAIELRKTPVDFKITNLGSIINTTFDEHSPVLNLDENLLLFTSSRNEDLSTPDNENVFFTVWRDGQWIEPKGVDFNTASNNATVSLSPDGKTLVLYQNTGDSGNLYYSEFKNDKWSTPSKFPSPINSAHRETHASFSVDGNSLYFSSDRPGGYGGKDIYKSVKLPNGEWGNVTNLGKEINTSNDEDSPFIHASDSLLFFASEGHNSMGGFDIFSATLSSDNNWGNIKNIGYPINTPFDDLFYSPTADGQRVYFASKRKDGFGGTDLYLIEFPDKHTNSLTAVGGFIYTDGEIPAVDADITLINKKNKKVEGIYKVNPNTGKYVFILAANEKFIMKINLEGYKPVTKKINIPSGKAFSRKGYTLYLDPVILEKDN